ncbi:hypothetical protein, partial [Burkholderia cenocepacia]|uniref:hypothetical protein n=1 Tax=Burkholderia cenocepacia TaxID=95486 RepID=UPI001E3F9847
RLIAASHSAEHRSAPSRRAFFVPRHSNRNHYSRSWCNPVAPTAPNRVSKLVAMQENPIESGILASYKWSYNAPVFKPEWL